MGDATNKIQAPLLHEALAQHFSFDELKLLCVNAGINPDSVPFAERGIDLFAFCMAEMFRQRNILPSLLRVCADARPDISWADLTVATTVPAQWTDLVTARNLINTAGGLVILGDVKADKIVGRDEITNVYGYTYEQAVALIQKIRREDQPRGWDGRTPYVGLAAFQEQDAALFFGRERLIDALTAQLHSSPALSVFGPSGSGKSSVIRAGLLVALKRGALDSSDKWLYAVCTPGDHPIDHLADALSAMALKANLPPSISDDLRAHGRTHPQSLHRLGQLLTQDTPGKHLVVFVDQFEESFTLTHDATERQAFFDLLTAAVNPPEGRTKVILSARSDFLSQCATHPELRRMINAQFRLIGAMEPEELARAIVMPALAVGASVQPALVSAMINETQGDPGMLPLMQFALKDLFDAQPRKEGQPVELTLDAYTARGGMRQILEQRADATFNMLSPAQQALAQRIFTGLIEVGRGTADTRRTVRIEELAPAGASQAEALGVIRVLSNERLLTTTADKDEPTDQVKGTVTIVHDRLIDAWPWLRKLVDERRQAIARQNEIADDAREWQAHGHDGSFLYADARLAFVLAEIEVNRLVLSEQAKAFLDASQAEQARREQQTKREQDEKLAAAQKLAEEQRARAEAERRRADDQAASSRRLRQRAVYLAVALVLAVAAVFGAVWFAREANQQAQIALARQLSAQASEDAVGNPVRAALLGIEAYRTVPRLDMLSGLLTTLQANLRARAALPGHADSVQSVAFSPDGKVLASGSSDKTIQLWDVSDPSQPKALGEPLRGHEGVVSSVAFSNDGKVLASGSWNNSLQLWDVSDPRRPQPLGEPLRGHKSAVSSVAFSPDGKLLASGSSDATIRLWDVSDPRQPKGLEELPQGYAGSVSSVAFSPDGKVLVSGNDDNTLRLWDVSDPRRPQPLGEPLRGHEAYVSSVAFSPDGKVLVSGSWDNTLRLWDVSDPRRPQPLGEPLRGHEGVVLSVAFSPDGKVLASASRDRTIRLWQVSDPRQPQPLGEPLRGHESDVSSVAFSNDGKTLASGSSDKTIRLWDVSDPRQPQPLGEPLRGHKSAVSSVAFSNDGKTLASGSSDKTIQLWDISDPRRPQPLGEPLRGHEAYVSSVAFSPDGKVLASGSWDNTLRLWDVSDPRRPQPLGEPLRGHEGVVSGVAFSPDGKVLASASRDRTIRLWQVSDPRRPQPLGEPLRGHAGDVSSVAFSNDGKTLASGSSGNLDITLRLWDVSDPHRPKLLGESLQGHEGVVLSVVFSPNGKVLASGGDDNTVWLWDVSDPHRPKALGEPLRGHEGAVSSVAFSPDGKVLTSGSRDRTIRLWDVSDPRQPKALGEPLRGHASYVLSVAFSPDGKVLASGSLGVTLRLWDVDPERWIDRACRITGRNLTQAEWRYYLPNTAYRVTCPQWSRGD